MPDLRLDAPPGPVTAYLAEPTTPGPHPGVVLIHEVFGLNDDLRAKADRFARHGYLALAPDLFSLGPKVKCVMAAFRALRAQHGPAFEAIDAARQELADREDCTGRVGVIGFCMGGAFALLSAAKLPFDAASVNYGQLPSSPEDVLRGACPIVASYGASDPPLKGTAARLEHALTQAGVEHDVQEYPGASHSFLTQYDGVSGVIARVTGLGHHGPSAEDAWRRIDAFFDRHLAATA